MKRLVSAVAILELLAAAWLVGSALPAGASTNPVSGTYQWYVQGSSPQTFVLMRNHTVGSPSDGTWSLSRHLVTVKVQGPPAGFVQCQKAGQPPNCTYGSVSTGPRTSTGIASQSSPGTWTGYVGSLAVVTEPFYAVRTGR
jgi:hypothetical protein